MQLALREEYLRYRFLPVAETKIAEALEIASRAANEMDLMNELTDQTKPAIQNAPSKQTKIEYGFLFQLASTGQITLDQVQVCNDDPIHINQISARKVAVYRYSGAWSELRYKRMLQRFLFELRKNQVETTGEPVFTRRDSENHFWTRRRNEIWLEVAR